jgi:hypothetical protein
MPVVPDTKLGKIQFAEEHVTPWTTNSVAMGSSAATITSWSAKVTTARAAYEAQKAAQNAAKAATNDLNIAMLAMNDATADVIRQIRTQAGIVGASVYSLAEIPAPATPGPVGAPGTPDQFKVLLRPDGTLDIRFACPNPPGCTGVIYQVYRKVQATDAYQYLGGTGQRKFIDSTVPSAVPSVMYQIQGVRSTAIGVANEFTVNFGVGSGGVVTASVADGKPAKVAA